MRAASRIEIDGYTPDPDRDRRRRHVATAVLGIACLGVGASKPFAIVAGHASGWLVVSGLALIWIAWSFVVVPPTARTRLVADPRGLRFGRRCVLARERIGGVSFERATLRFEAKTDHDAALEIRVRGAEDAHAILRALSLPAKMVEHILPPMQPSGSVNPHREALLARRGRPLHAWLADVRAIGYRTAAIPDAELWAVLEDERADDTARAAAAIALGPAADAARRERALRGLRPELRALVDSCASR